MNRRRIAAAAFTIALWSVAGCSTWGEPPCATGETRAVSDTLYFGTAQPGGVVTLEEWQTFLQASVTPRFPQGFTVWPASGQWRGADGKTVQETSRVLSLVHADDQAADNAVRAIAADYKARFAQEAVLRVKARACQSL